MPKMKRKPKQTFSWMNPKLEIRPALKYGKNEKGVFAKEDIKKGEALFVIDVKDITHIINTICK